MHQSSSREIGGGRMNTAGISQRSHSQEHNNGQSQSQQQYQESQNDDFLEQILSTIPNCSWPPTPNDLPSPTANPNTKIDTNNSNFKSRDSHPDNDSAATVAAAFQFPFDERTLISKLGQQQQITEVTAKSLLLQHQQQQQQQFLLSRRSPAEAMLSLPLSLGNPDSVDASTFKSQAAAEASVQALYNGLAASVHANAQPDNQQHFHPPPPQGGSVSGGQKASASTGVGAPQRQRVRARRGQATDPHSIAERLRRERIAERMKALQELVPNANKTDKASMLDEIIDYVKFLQLQVKVLSMSRLGGAAAVAPPVTDMNSEGVGRSTVGNTGNQTAPTNDGLTVTEHQVAKLMEEDMSSAMQYLQGKGLCLMPISLASSISATTTSLARIPGRPHGDNNSNYHTHDFNDNNHHHHHSLYPVIPASNGEEDPPADSSIQDPSTS